MIFRILGRRTDNIRIDDENIHCEQEAIKLFSDHIKSALEVGAGLHIQLRIYTDVKVWHEFRKAEISGEVKD